MIETRDKPHFLIYTNILQQGVVDAAQHQGPRDREMRARARGAHGGDGYDRGPQAAEERLPRVRCDKAGRSLGAEILEIGRRCASLPDRNTRTADEILGIDEYGAAELVVSDTSAIIAALLNEANAVGIAGRSTPLPRVAFYVVSREADTTPARHNERKMSPGFSSEALSFGTALGDSSGRHSRS